MSRARPGTEKGAGLSGLIPILDWVPKYQRTWLRPDLVAGLMVAALVVPESLGYAGIAGVPLQYGLYAAAAGVIIYALLGTSRQIATGQSSALAAVAAGAVIAASASGKEILKLVASITFVTGVLFLLPAAIAGLIGGQDIVGSRPR